MIRPIALAALAALTLSAGKSDPLEGRVAGKPATCIDLDFSTSPQIVDAHTILYRQSGKRIWKTGPVGDCPSLRPFDTLIVDAYGTRICRNDRFRTVQNGMSIPSGYCRFRDFTPYDKP